jgi:hypothetical protein
MAASGAERRMARSRSWIENMAARFLSRCP